MTALEYPREHESRPGSPKVITRVASSEAEMESVYSIRREVFVREQELTRTVYDEPDDRQSVHLLAQVAGRIVGTGRLTMIRDEAQIAWVAIRAPERGTGAGKALMQHLLAISGERGAQFVTLNAQTHALGFYEKLGFEPIGRRFFMGNIEHQYMVRILQDR
ncbi:MAG: GNAT family N-acetyltransferase [Chloroflexota bacterium]